MCMVHQILSDGRHPEPVVHTAAVALTQISAYSTHKNLTVRKIMEVMRTAYAKSGI